mmetsp:Transcript_238/g.643  ORF Transcript_238/g.643 Transcript_238/m.643 type:complete len:285 (+) Transcript_238:137-991(+)
MPHQAKGPEGCCGQVLEAAADASNRACLRIVVSPGWGGAPPQAGQEQHRLTLDHAWAGSCHAEVDASGSCSAGPGDGGHEGAGPCAEAAYARKLPSHRRRDLTHTALAQQALQIPVRESESASQQGLWCVCNGRGGEAREGEAGGDGDGAQAEQGGCPAWILPTVFTPCCYTRARSQERHPEMDTPCHGEGSHCMEQKLAAAAIRRRGAEGSDADAQPRCPADGACLYRVGPRGQSGHTGAEACAVRSEQIHKRSSCGCLCELRSPSAREASTQRLCQGIRWHC